MVRQLFQIIWHNRRKNFLVIVEIAVSFMIMFAIFTLLVSYLKNYRQPRGFRYDDAWVILYENPWRQTGSDTVVSYVQNLKERLENFPGITAVSLCGHNFPYSMNEQNAEVQSGSLRLRSGIYPIGEEYSKVLGLELIKGKWFEGNDTGSRRRPVVINRSLEEALFSNRNSLGETIRLEGRDMKIVGVVADLKTEGDYQPAGNQLFIPLDAVSFSEPLQTMLIRVSPAAGEAFEASLFKIFSAFIQDREIKIEHLSDLRLIKNNVSMVPVIILLILAGFLIFNVALGLLGILWYNINTRRGEIGLRMAVGATKSSIGRHMTAEALVIATFAILLATVFAVQFPLLNVFDIDLSIYAWAFVLALGFIYGLVFLCALYPAKQAASVLPAVALHEE